MIRRISLLLGFIVSIHCLDYGSISSCCAEKSILHNPQCVRACHQVSPNAKEIRQLHRLTYIVQKCPSHLFKFWRCVNASFSAIKNVELWWGRPCCQAAVTRQCADACQLGFSRTDVKDFCRQGDESAFYSCLDRQERGENCCQHGSTHQCNLACRAVFANENTPRRREKDAVRRNCQAQSPRVVVCMENATKGTPANNPQENLPCCELASSDHCKATCKRALTTLKTEDDIVNEMINACGLITLTDGMWKCFLSGSDKSKKNRNKGIASIDGAKIQCCAWATTPKCKDLCVKTYSHGFSQYYDDFMYHCHRQRELNLFTCIDEVDKPCTLGCGGLNFCENFNNRPTELFRNCDTLHDNEAKLVISNWMNREIRIKGLNFLTIPVKNINTCKPELWKAIACTLNIKPCHNTTLGHKVCRSDCLNVLNHCVDRERMGKGKTVGEICDVLSPMVTDNENCISLSKYLTPSIYVEEHKSVDHPCSPNPCNVTQICMVNRRKCKHSERCKPYICKEGCPMGEASMFVVPHGALVRVPEPTRKLNCHMVCRCGHHGVLSKCHSKTCMRVDKPCFVGNIRGVAPLHRHGTTFDGPCNLQCACMESKLICTRRSCLVGNVTIQDRRRFTGLPCSCLYRYQPVCGKNGKTYPSDCIARCGGLSDNDFIDGRCEDQNPCLQMDGLSPCNHGEICVPKKQVCIGNVKRFCRQYECISPTSLCNHHHHDEVCDTRNEEHTNLCLLYQKNRRLSYWGHCKKNCTRRGVVCGHNGKTYSSECEAWSDQISVDYQGVCIAIGQLQKNKTENSVCYDVRCPEWTFSKCVGITPPGACCPICAGELRILFSRALEDRATHNANLAPITVQNITKRLLEHVTIPQCEVFGYLSIEVELVIIVMATGKPPTIVQVQACNTEALRLSALITTKNPRIMSDLMFYPVLSSKVRISSVRIPGPTPSSQASATRSGVTLWTVISLLGMLVVWW